MQGQNEAILQAASEFLFSDSFQAAADKLAETHGHLFLGAQGLEGEQRLEWQEVYKAYRAVYERVLEDFLSKQNISLEAFAEACQDALTNSEWQHLKGFVEVVLSVRSRP